MMDEESPLEQALKEAREPTVAQLRFRKTLQFVKDVSMLANFALMIIIIVISVVHIISYAAERMTPTAGITILCVIVSLAYGIGSMAAYISKHGWDDWVTAPREVKRE